MDKVIEFFKRRSWLRGNSRTDATEQKIITHEEYETLKEKGTLGKERDAYLKAFSDGWRAAK